MLNQMLAFLLDTLLGLFSLALLLRFLMQLLRAPYRNPLSPFLIALTDFLVRPVRRIIPGFRGMDLATLLLAWLTQLLLLSGCAHASGLRLQFIYRNRPRGARAPGGSRDSQDALYIIMVAVIVQALLSWINPHSPIAPVLDSFTRPFLRGIRARIPPIGNVDLSPLFVLIIIQLLLFVVTGMEREISRLF